MVALQVAKDYNNGQRYFAGSPVAASGYVFLFSLKYVSLDE